jgi:hypothetical protein
MCPEEKEQGQFELVMETEEARLTTTVELDGGLESDLLLDVLSLGSGLEILDGLTRGKGEESGECQNRTVRVDEGSRVA